MRFFSVWGYFKSKLYTFQDTANNLNELRGRIFNSLQNITPDALAYVLENFYHRLFYLIFTYIFIHLYAIPETIFFVHMYIHMKQCHKISVNKNF